MKEKKIRLSREQIKQLSDANAESLEKEIVELQVMGAKTDLNFRVFWQKSDGIHSIFKKITPLEKSERKRLWNLFQEVREKVKKRQAREKDIEKNLLERVSKEVGSLLEEVKEIIEKKSEEPFEVETLLFLLEQLKSAAKGDISALPDTPEKAFLIYRCNKRLKYDKNLNKEIAETIKEVEKWLKNLAKRKFEEIKLSINKLINEIGNMPLSKVKKTLRAISNEILAPYLLKQQKEVLKNQIAKIYVEIGKEKKDKQSGKITEERQNDKTKEGKIPAMSKNSAENIKEITIFLEEIEQSILKHN